MVFACEEEKGPAIVRVATGSMSARLTAFIFAQRQWETIIGRVIDGSYQTHLRRGKWGTGRCIDLTGEERCGSEEQLDEEDGMLTCSSGRRRMYI